MADKDYRSQLDRLDSTLTTQSEKRANKGKFEGLTETLEDKIGEGATLATYAGAGAGLGLAGGSVVPGIGNLVGAAGGGIFGAYTYWRVKKKARDEKKARRYDP